MRERSLRREYCLPFNLCYQRGQQIELSAAKILLSILMKYTEGNMMVAIEIS